MKNETHDTYQYLKLQSNTFSKSNHTIPGKKLTDIVLDLNHLKAIKKSLLGILIDLNKDQISKGYCLILVKSDLTDLSKLDSLIVVPTIKEAEDYIQMERIQRDLDF